MVHRAGTRLGDNLGVWSLSVMVQRTSVYGTRLVMVVYNLGVWS